MENTTNTIIVKTQKSPTTAALLSFFFGPLGMFYSTILGAIIMLIISAVIAFFTLGFGLLVTIPICSLWAYLAVKRQNRKELEVTQQAAQA